MSKADHDNRSNQMNPNNDAYYSARGMDRHGDDDDSEWVSRAYGYHRPVSYAPTFSLHEFHAVRVTMEGQVQRGKIALRGRESLHQDEAAEELFHRHRIGHAYFELRDPDGKLLHSYRYPLEEVPVRSDLKPLQVLSRLEQALLYREQANDAMEAYREGIVAAVEQMRNLPSTPPLGGHPCEWESALDYFGERFKSVQGLMPGDLRAAQLYLREFSLELNPPYAQLAALHRRAIVLLGAWAHRTRRIDQRGDAYQGNDHQEWLRNRNLRNYLEQKRSAVMTTRAVDDFLEASPAADAHWDDWGVYDANYRW